MKKMVLMVVSLISCLYLTGCGSPDRNQWDREPLTAQAESMAQESNEWKNGTQLKTKDTSILQEELDAQTEWDGQEEDTQETTNLVSIEDWKALPVGEYPINTESPEWKTISFCDALAACDMPKEYAESLSSDDLSKYAGNYPFLGHILAYDSIEDGINSLKEKSTVFEELFSRSDCDEALLKEYRNMSCDYKILEKQHDMSASGYLKQIFLEAYFGLHYGNLSQI